MYALQGDLVKDPIFGEDGELKEDRLTAVLCRLWDGTAKKPRDWIPAWQAMVIPMEKQTEVLQKFLNLAFARQEDPEAFTAILAELVQAHKLKLRAVEEVLVSFGANLDGITAVYDKAWHFYAHFFVCIFPKPSGTGWGWSRIGWAFSSWWQFVVKCIQSVEASQAFDMIALALAIMQEKEGANLSEIPDWTQSTKLQTILTKLCDTCGCDATEAIERLAEKGVVVEAA